MSFVRRLFGQASGRQPPASAEALDLSVEWRQFFENAPLHEDTRGVVTGFVGPWPEGLDPNLFSSSSWPAIVRRVREHLAMPYPVAEFRKSSPPPRPDYRVVDGKVLRASKVQIDFYLLLVLPAGEQVRMSSENRTTVMA